MASAVVTADNQIQGSTVVALVNAETGIGTFHELRHTYQTDTETDETLYVTGDFTVTACPWRKRVRRADSIALRPVRFS